MPYRNTSILGFCTERDKKCSISYNFFARAQFFRLTTVLQSIKNRKAASQLCEAALKLLLNGLIKPHPQVEHKHKTCYRLFS